MGNQPNTEPKQIGRKHGRRMAFIRTPQRKVTLTEMPEEWELSDHGLFDIDDDVFEDEEEDVEKTTEEIFACFEEVIQDWKIKLEFVVSDGLKKIKKLTKEKKMMMKYLPGDGIPKSSQYLRQAKAEIVSEWNKEMKTALRSTHKSLDKLGSEKVRESTTKSKVMFFQNEKTVETLQVNKNKSVQIKPKQGSFQNLKLAIEQLQRYVQNTASMEPQSMYLPIYKPNMANMTLAPAKLTKWDKWRSMLNMMMEIRELPVDNTCMMPKTEEDIMEVLKNFTADQNSFNKTLEQWNNINESAAKRPSKLKFEAKQSRRGELKQPRRGSNNLIRMKERKERSKQFRLCEFKNKAGSHYLVVKRKEKPIDVPIEVEDIFAEWKPNFGEEVPLVKRVKRVRKLSHRQERKGLIKEAEKEENKKQTGPLTYCDVLKKNMKWREQQPLIEEILESWAQYMEELNEMVKTPQISADEVEDIFKTWKHNFVERKVKLIQRLEAPEEIFQMWQHNLKEPADYYKTPTKYNVQNKEPKRSSPPLKIHQNKRKQNPVENTFQDWASKLILEKPEESGRGEAVPTKTGPEEFFIDWLQQGCLQEPKAQRPAKPGKLAPEEQPEQTPVTKRRLNKKHKDLEMDEVELTPTMKRRLSQKQKAKQTCPEEETDFEGIKDSRRDDFKASQKIKNKKRNEASRRSGKTVYVN